MAAHSNGIALIFARTETQHFERSVWPHARALYFFFGRLNFFRPDGVCGDQSGGAPSVLVGYGDEGLRRLHRYSRLPLGKIDAKTGLPVAPGRRPGWLVFP